MTRIHPLRWLSVAILIFGSLLSALLLLPRDTPSQGGSVVVSAPSSVPVWPPTRAVAEAEPALVGVLLQGRASTARLRLADGSILSVALDQQPMPGWTLVAVDSASATFATPAGREQLKLEEGSADERSASTTDRDAPTILIPEAAARSADGEAIERCLDPEC
ncbi:hypothetical protein DMC47_07500 [Nostoc sp. 3335mG]|nr:hypothetical protein DMC47_07500 [Nostoc sp. 3335mG]